ncbi:hypothetical protein BD410DRAFT_168041 [Rickenella mellea]|uniref:Uncharacterized protein n=1 Tax=Rickenella mellea TaxID=50990 RepID=A0A4Y7PHJ1_9AGAM|nr:hypothetical protein BD410DRAFT_168041 [Rickenella mellea]
MRCTCRMSTQFVRSLASFHSQFTKFRHIAQHSFASFEKPKLTMCQSSYTGLSASFYLVSLHRPSVIPGAGLYRAACLLALPSTVPWVYCPPESAIRSAAVRLRATSAFLKDFTFAVDGRSVWRYLPPCTIHKCDTTYSQFKSADTEVLRPPIISREPFPRRTRTILSTNSNLVCVRCKSTVPLGGPIATSSFRQRPLTKVTIGHNFLRRRHSRHVHHSIVTDCMKTSHRSIASPVYVHSN